MLFDKYCFYRIPVYYTVIYRVLDDWGDKPNDGAFAFNGILRADRSPNPAFYEVFKCYQRIRCTLDKNVLTIRNKFSFGTLDCYTMQLTLRANGVDVYERAFDCASLCPSLPPFCSFKYTLPKDFAPKADAEYSLLVQFRQKQATPYAESGHIVAFEDFELNRLQKNIVHAEGNVKYEHEGDVLTVYAGPTTYVVNVKTGYIDNVLKCGKEYLTSPIKPQFWRAITNNDQYQAVSMVNVDALLGLSKYRRAMQKLKSTSCDLTEGDGALTVDFKMHMPHVTGFVIRYMFYQDGTVRMTMVVTPLADLVRYGFECGLAKGLDGVTYYGKGEHEAYCDRDRSAIIGVYHKTGEEMIHDYLSPQENGNRMDVRWATIGDKQKVRFTAVSHNFQLGVHPYTLEMLDEAKHLHELGRTDYLTVNIDGAQRGVGGDLPAMACLKKPYKLPKLHTYILAVDLSVE